MQNPSKFETDVPFGPIDATYSPSERMRQTINGIAELEGLPFRFWAAKTLYVNLSSIAPCQDAEQVVFSVVDAAVAGDEPTDGAYQIVFDETGNLAGVAHEDDDDQEASKPEEVDRLIYEIIRQSSVADRRDALTELATLCAISSENEAVGDRLNESRFWSISQTEGGQ